MTFERLLILAEWCCGADARDRVFEPLLADWQHEWRDAQRVSSGARAKVLVSGTIAFAYVLATSTIRQLCSMPPPEASRRALRIFLLTLATGLVVQIGAWLLWLKAYPPAALARPPIDLLYLAAFFKEAMPAATALAVFPTLCLMHVDQKRPLVPAQFLLGATIVTFVVCGWLVPVTNKPLMEAMRQRQHTQAMEDERAGRYTYPGSALRARRKTTAGLPHVSTLELPTNMTFPELIVAMFADMPSGRSTQVSPFLRQMMALPILTLSFGLMGVGFVRLGGPDVTRAVVWWLVAWFIVASPMGVVVRRMPIGQFWVLVAAFAAAGIALLVAGARATPTRPTRLTSLTRFRSPDVG